MIEVNSILNYYQEGYSVGCDNKQKWKKCTTNNNRKGVVWATHSNLEPRTQQEERNNKQLLAAFYKEGSEERVKRYYCTDGGRHYNNAKMASKLGYAG